MAHDSTPATTAKSPPSEHDNPKMGQFQAMHDQGTLDLNPFRKGVDDVWHRSNPPKISGGVGHVRKGPAPESPLKAVRSVEDLGKPSVVESKPKSIWDDEFEEDLDVYNNVRSPRESTAGSIDNSHTPAPSEAATADSEVADADEQDSQSDGSSNHDSVAGGSNLSETGHDHEVSTFTNKPTTVHDYVAFLEQRLQDEQFLADQLRIALHYGPQQFDSWKNEVFVRLQNDRWQIKTEYTQEVRALKARIGFYRDMDTLTKDGLIRDAEAAKVDATAVDTTPSPSMLKALASLEQIRMIVGLYRPAKPRSQFTRH